MLQQTIALIIIVFFVFRIFWQRQKNHINNSEFIFWLIFWIAGAIAIIFIKKIDSLVARLGFERAGIEILFYIAVIILFYLIFKIRIRQAKIEKEITKLTREMAIKNKE